MSEKSSYANLIVVRAADKAATWEKTLVEPYRNESIRKFINEQFKGAPDCVLVRPASSGENIDPSWPLLGHFSFVEGAF